MLKYKLRISVFDMRAASGPGDSNDWDTFERFLCNISSHFEYIPGDPDWYIYIIRCKEEDLTLIKLHFPAVHIDYEMYS
jgi:hypothetical protein